MPFDIAESQNETSQSNFFIDNRELFTSISQVAGIITEKDTESKSLGSILNVLQTKNKGDLALNTESSSSNNTPLLKSGSLVFNGEGDLLGVSDGIPSVMH